MRNDLRANPAVKAVIVILLIAFGIMALVGGFYCLYHSESIFGGGNYTSTNLYSITRSQKCAAVRRLGV